MKKIISILMMLMLANQAVANDNFKDKFKNLGGEIKEGFKEISHKGQEIICDKTDQRCIAERAKQKAAEAKQIIDEKTHQTPQKRP